MSEFSTIKDAAETLKRLLPTYICDNFEPYNPKSKWPRCGDCKACKITAALDALAAPSGIMGAALPPEVESALALSDAHKELRAAPEGSSYREMEQALHALAAHVRAVPAPLGSLEKVREALVEAEGQFQGIVTADYRNWPDGLNTPEDFVTWAKSRASLLLERCRAALSLAQGVGTNHAEGCIFADGEDRSYLDGKYAICTCGVAPSPALTEGEQPLGAEGEWMWGPWLDVPDEPEGHDEGCPDFLHRPDADCKWWGCKAVRIAGAPSSPPKENLE